MPRMRSDSRLLFRKHVERSLSRSGLGLLLGFAASLADHLVVDECLREEGAVMRRTIEAGDLVMRLPAIDLRACDPRV